MNQAADYWKKLEEHSRVKADIVASYLGLWAEAVKKSGEELNYLDLFAGEGYHDDGQPGTPLRVIRNACENQYLRNNLHILFNDERQDACQKLREAVSGFEFTSVLRHPPSIHNISAGPALAKILADTDMRPTFCFLDPCGYVGLTLELICAVLKGWGSDCLVFLQSNNINRFKSLSQVKPHIIKLLGQANYDKMIIDCRQQRGSGVNALIGAFTTASRGVGAKQVLSFQFNHPNSRHVSHHLVFLTKHDRGFNFMKKAMAPHSQLVDGVPTWTYCEGWADAGDQQCLRNHGPMADLRGQLREDFAGYHISKADLIKACDERGYLYTEQNIRDAVLQLEQDRHVTVDVPRSRRMRLGRPTLGDKRMITFH